MNLPNKLTMFRVILVPFFVYFLLESESEEWFKWIALGIFIVASLTDLLDGKIARKYNLVTTFGKFMDPLADKLLVCSALIALIPLEMMPAWATIIIIAREFIISGFRLIAAEKGVVIAASYWGKVKTTVQMVMVCVMLVIVNGHGFMTDEISFTSNFTATFYMVLERLSFILLILAVALTVISLVDYLVKNKGVIQDTKES
ncbi:MAG: CDP-diacylglycerol--glycerol-3-phosphate 3-phosphatidyltransferase [Lachnospiraceae bacterium]|nr:CDP-diacylglycerol--glycerol-3-phosphate 3-phosphatidyltransferase [Lachnospiraceae bacterium]